MSLENNEAHDLSPPDMPSGRPTNAGAIDGMQNLPPLNWDLPDGDPVAKAKAKADWEAAKERAVQADPSALSQADRFARHRGLKELQATAKVSAKAAEKGQAANLTVAEGQVAGPVDNAVTADPVAPASKTRKASATKTRDQVLAKDKAPNVVDGVQQVDAVTKPARKARGSTKTANTGTQVQPAGSEAAKPARLRTKAALKGVVQEQVQAASAAAPASDGMYIPPMTDEALAFLNDPDAKAVDLFKLQPNSREFVQFHITNMQRLEALSERNYTYLMSMAPKITPAFEKAAVALLQKKTAGRHAGIKPAVANVPKSAEATTEGVSYRPKLAPAGALHFTPVQLGKMSIEQDKGVDQVQASADRAADLQLANRVIGTAHVMMSAPIGDVTREQAADLVAGDVEDFRVIKDESARQLALNAMIESSHAQPHYKDAFEQLAPDLVPPAKEANAAMGTDRNAPSQSVPNVSNQNAENTIERGIESEREYQPGRDTQQSTPQQSTPTVEPVASGATQPVQGIGKRMLRAVGAWLQGKAEEKGPAVPVSNANPVSLEKPVAPAAQTDDKSTVVPDAVARRFLKVERDYYFPDRTPAFSDQGNKLATRGAHPEVVRSLVEIAQARGWDSITVKGTDQFRRSAWMEATQAGLKVAGYKPTALDLAELSSKPATNTVEKGIAREREASAGRQSPAQSSKPVAAAQANASKAIDPVPSPELEAKARAFEKEKPGFVMKKFPELAQAYGVVDAAKKFAEANLPQDVRDEFVSLARRHVMQKILAGEQVKGPQIYTAPAKVKDGVEQGQAQERPAVDLGKDVRSKEVARER